MLKMIARLATLLATSLILLTNTANAEGGTVLQTRNAKKHCKIVSPWIDEIKRSAGQDILQEGNGTSISTQEFIERVAPMFSDEKFVPVFGKRYRDLDVAESRTAGLAIANCFSAMGSYYHLVSALRRNYMTPNWDAAVELAQADTRSIEQQMHAIRQKYELRADTARRSAETAERNKALIAAAEQLPRKNLPNRAGKLLRSTEQYKIHEYRSNTHDVKEFCPVVSAGFQSYSVVFSDRTAILQPSRIQEILQNDLEPVNSQVCPTAGAVEAWFYFKDVYLDGAGNIRTRAEIESSAVVEVPFIVARKSNSWSQQNWMLNYLRDLDQKDEPSLAGLSILKGRGFLSREDAKWLSDQKAEDERQIHLYGFLPKVTEVRHVTRGGDEMMEYFQFNRANLLQNGSAAAVILGWSDALASLCPNDMPGGVAIAELTTTKYVDRTEESQDTSQLRIPRELFAHYQYLVNADRQGRGRTRRDIRDEMMAIISHAGCSSPALTEIQQNIVAIAPTIYFPQE